MKINIEFEKMKQMILAAAKFQGLSSEYVDDKWILDYTVDFDKKFKRIVDDLNENIKLLDQALKHNDLLSATVAITGSKVHAHMLMNFFEDINDDFMRLGWGKELKGKWSKHIPDDYKIPEEYGCVDTSRPFSEQIVPRVPLPK